MCRSGTEEFLIDEAATLPSAACKVVYDSCQLQGAGAAYLLYTEAGVGNIVNADGLLVSTPGGCTPLLLRSCGAVRLLASALKVSLQRSSDAS